METVIPYTGRNGVSISRIYVAIEPFSFPMSLSLINVLIDRNEQHNEGEKQKKEKNKKTKRSFICGKKASNIYVTNFVNVFHSSSPLKCVNIKKHTFPNKNTII